MKCFAYLQSWQVMSPSTYAASPLLRREGVARQRTLTRTRSSCWSSIISNSDCLVRSNAARSSSICCGQSTRLLLLLPVALLLPLAPCPCIALSSHPSTLSGSQSFSCGTFLLPSDTGDDFL